MRRADKGSAGDRKLKWLLYFVSFGHWRCSLFCCRLYCHWIRSTIHTNNPHVLRDDFCNDEQFRRNHTSTSTYTLTSSNCFVHIAHIYTAMTKETKMKLWWMRGDQWQRMEKKITRSKWHSGSPGSSKRMKYILVDSSFICVRDRWEKLEWTMECEHGMHTRRREEKIRTNTHTYANPTDERENGTFLIWFSLDVAISAHKKIRRDNKND